MRNSRATDVNEVHVVARASEPAYIPVVSEIVRQTHADLLLTNVTPDIAAISAGRHRLYLAIFLPDHETIMLCNDKEASNAVWQAAGSSAAEHADK